MPGFHLSKCQARPRLCVGRDSAKCWQRDIWGCGREGAECWHDVRIVYVLPVLTVGRNGAAYMQSLDNNCLPTISFYRQSRSYNVITYFRVHSKFIHDEERIFCWQWWCISGYRVNWEPFMYIELRVQIYIFVGEHLLKQSNLSSVFGFSFEQIGNIA